MEQAVKEFFERYERANASSDLITIGTMYADTFMFGGPKGVQAVKKEVFLSLVPRMKAHFDSIGLCETRLKAVEARAIDSKYLLAKVEWKMTVRNSTGERKSVDAFASYVLEEDADTLSIVLQIDHQDLASAIAQQ
ncbi:MAG TPA: hypothetical protein VG498_01035 [Terriglobales bacterium]|nr:hypothetical protein [Terriglobales bacterium]